MEEKMRILYFIHGLTIGGAETIAVNHILSLKKRGERVALVVYDDRPSFLRDRVVSSGIPYYSILPYCSYSIFGKLKRYIFKRTVDVKKRWSEIIDDFKPDVVHYHDYSSVIKNLPFYPERSVMTFHSDVLRAIEEGGEELSSFFRTLADNKTTFFSLSDKMTNDIRSIFKTDRVEKVGNSVDVELIRSNAYSKDHLKTLAVPEDAFIVGHVGRFHPIKNHERLIDIFNEVVKIEEKAYLLLIGGDHGNRVDSIKERVKKLGISDRVLFLGTKNDATSLMGCFDALVLPSFSESFSLVLIEAQTLGVRCVASDAVPKDVFLNDNCFSLSLDRSDREWAELITGKERKNESGDISVYDTENVVDKIIKAYSAIVRKGDELL